MAAAPPEPERDSSRSPTRAPRAPSSEPEAQAAALWGARQSGTCIDTLQDIATEEAGYLVQARAVASAGRFGSGVVGWKCGPCAAKDVEASQMREPGRAPIFAGGRWASGATVPLAAGTASYARVLEAEVGFVLAAGLPPRSTPYTDAEVWAAVGQVVPCLEICSSRFAPALKTQMTAYQRLADCGNNLGVVVGSGVARAEVSIEALRDVKVELRQNGERVASGTGQNGVVPAADGKGSPVASLVWLANHLALPARAAAPESLGRALEAGDVVISGATCVMKEPQAGDRVTGVFDLIGEVEVSIS